MNAKFSVGEVVILQSRSRPECNGEYSVSAIVYGVSAYIDPHTGTLARCINRRNDIAYVLSDPNLLASDGDGKQSATWLESALRKKHQPGELSYSELLETLSIKAEVSMK